MTREEMLKELEGMEILSFDFAGCVMVHEGKIIQMGEVVDPNPSHKTLKGLMNEIFMWEFGSDWEQDLIDEMKSYE